MASALHPVSVPAARTSKDIALFTPAGDLVYCCDIEASARWHADLCVQLQELLGLPEPPHFLVPSHTATIVRWLDPETQQVVSAAELYPPGWQHRSLLSAAFGLANNDWRVLPWQEECCDPLLLQAHRGRFPQLWDCHEAIVQCTLSEALLPTAAVSVSENQLTGAIASPTGYVLRLFVSGRSPLAESILATLHQLLDRRLQQPYTLKVVDISKHPEQAELNQVSATPTLVRVWPKPLRRIVGGWDNLQRLLDLVSAT
ncbi:KaiB domain protein [Rubidibacter lacunae KORDI 51-2]|uniref:KaiB domain protein n=2 Tax=Rubidibacter TaxID=582491 RepID=U5DJQ2_9CHRO|nr:circadian clock KaiB family protein [Rubidibacter lacunae]ERN40809.1 KaiB domain protein [Rubidibacter lacunae KORDI 51-2]